MSITEISSYILTVFHLWICKFVGTAVTSVRPYRQYLSVEKFWDLLWRKQAYIPGIDMEIGSQIRLGFALYEWYLYDSKITFLRLDPNSEDGGVKISALKIFLNGTLLALIIAIPAIISTVVFHYVIKTNLIITISAGIITLFVAMGFAYKISKRLSM